ncbi:CRISPR-associated protein Csy2 [Vibrio sp.]|nr:CRISPR-associated protein Csy2 [Vibrio sp.]
MNTLSDLLTKYKDSDELTLVLRKAFRPLTPHIDITDSPLEALTVLVNLTDKVKKQRDLLDQLRCKEKIRDEKWWRYSLKTAQYRHSHNVKFPDIRASGIIRAKPIGELPHYLFSSSKLEPLNWSYSQDSKYVNLAIFLTSEFIWENNICCLANVLKNPEHSLWSSLKKLGCYEKQKKVAIKQLKAIPHHLIDVELASNYLKQISVSDGKGSYITLSPVSSQSVQSHCYQAIEGKYKLTALMYCSRATSMGLLPMSCGGTFRLIESMPFIGRQKHQYLNTRTQWLTKEYIDALDQFCHQKDWLIPSNQRRKFQHSLKNSMTNMLKLWLTNENEYQPDYSAEKLAEKFNADLALTSSASRFAYNPNLTKTFIQLFFKLIDEEVPSTNSITNDQQGTFLVLPNLRVTGANAMNTPVSIGLPSMIGMWGFLHAFERKMQTHNTAFEMDSFAVCVHSGHIENRGLTKEHTLKTNGKIDPPATRDDWQFDGNITFIIRLKNVISVTKTDIARMLPKRLARGTTKFTINGIDGFKCYSHFKEAVTSISAEQGKWLSLAPLTELNDINCILDALNNDSELSTNCVGYHLLEKPSDKLDSLRSYPHAFAETILGLTKSISISKITNWETLFWQYRYTSNGPLVIPRSIE